MRKCLIAAVMLSAAVVFASCERNDNSVPECNLAISMGSDGNTVRVSVAPSDESVDYLYGIIMEDDYAALGEDGLVAYINELISKGAELKQGSSSELYSDLFWHTRYYAFAAQVNDGTVYGTPVVESIRTYRPYVDFAPEGVRRYVVVAKSHGKHKGFPAHYAHAFYKRVGDVVLQRFHGFSLFQSGGRTVKSDVHSPLSARFLRKFGVFEVDNAPDYAVRQRLFDCYFRKRLPFQRVYCHIGDEIGVFHTHIMCFYEKRT